MKIVSACLIGMNCAWDGKDRYKNEKVMELLKQETLIPVCPEQLGGLPTPRTPAEIIDNKVITKEGEDVTAQFEKGAYELLKIARIYSISEFIAKQNSPSCGCGRTYDGSFTGKLIEGDGITSSLLKKNGIRVITEEEI